MNATELKTRLISKLLQLPVCTVRSMETQYEVRCPFCGDSIKHFDHGHLSIHIDASSLDDWMPYRCFRCGAFGHVDPDFFELIDISLQADEREALLIFLKRATKSNRYIDKNPPLVVPNYKGIDWTMTMNAKIEYIANRLGITFEELKDDIAHLKIIVNLISFCKINHIMIPDKSEKQMVFSNFNYVGFLSSNSNLITLRRFTDQEELRRYDKIILNMKNLNANTFYNIPFEFNYLDTSPINVHIAEGTFDILSIYYNVMKKNEDHNFYFACCGFLYSSIIKYLVSNGIVSDVTLHIYCDKDKSDEDLWNLLKRDEALLMYFDEIYVHRNRYINELGEIEKDYGTFHIIDEKYVLG